MGGYDQSPDRGRPSARPGRPASRPASSSSTRPRSTEAARASASSAACWRPIPGGPPGRRRHQVHAEPVEGERPRALLRRLRASRERLGIDVMDLYQIHGPISLRSHDALAEALAAAHGRDWCGPSACRTTRSKRPGPWTRPCGTGASGWPATRSSSRSCGAMPATRRAHGACRELGVVPLAYSPIGQGRLTGKYSAANPPPGQAHLLGPPDGRWSTGWSPSSAGSARPTATARPSQVALAWLIAKGAVPIPGAKNRDAGPAERGRPGLDHRRRRPCAAGPGGPGRDPDRPEPHVAARLSRPATQASVETWSLTCMEPSTVRPWHAPFLDHSIRTIPRPTRVPDGAKASAMAAGT